MRFSLNTLTNSRRTMARLLRLYNKDELTGDKYRNLIYGMAKFLEYWKAEKNLDIEERLTKLEQYLEDRR